MGRLLEAETLHPKLLQLFLVGADIIVVIFDFLLFPQAVGSS